jgi:hypothetical protein
MTKPDQTGEARGAIRRSAWPTRKERYGFSGLPTTVGDKEYILLRIEHDPNGGCWLWSGRIGSHGYGAASGQRCHKDAHRLSYSAFKGEIPTGLHVLHKCDVRCCVNPDHLFVGTQSDNMRDMHAKGRGRGSMKPRWNRIPDDIRAGVLASTGQTKAEIARRFGIAGASVRAILKGALHG